MYLKADLTLPMYLILLYSSLLFSCFSFSIILCFGRSFFLISPTSSFDRPSAAPQHVCMCSSPHRRLIVWNSLPNTPSNLTNFSTCRNPSFCLNVLYPPPLVDMNVFPLSLRRKNTVTHTSLYNEWISITLLPFSASLSLSLPPLLER